MVQISTRAFFVFSIAVSSFAVPLLLKRTVEQVKTDIANISTQVTALDTLITNYPTTGGTLLGALVRASSDVRTPILIPC
jgi:hypothetical protein